MKTNTIIVALALTFFSAILSSCESPEQLQAKEDRRNAGYQSFEQKREIRQEARQEREDMSFDRTMGIPVGGSTGLRNPGDPPNQ